MRPVSTRERKLIAIGLLVLVLWAIESMIVAPFIEGFTARAEQRRLLQMTYQRNAALVDSLPVLRRRADAQKAILARYTIVAPNQALARDRLKERLLARFGDVGGEVTAMQDVTSGKEDVRGWIEGRLTLPQLQDLIARLQNEAPYLIIESLRVSADRALESGRLDLLDVRLEASIPFTASAS